MGRVVIVQRIATHWTKASRGGANAGRRNSVMEVARVPVERIQEANPTLVEHILGYDESENYHSPREQIRLNSTVRPIAAGCVAITFTDDTLFATFRYDMGCGGAPDRSWIHKSLRVPLNRWGQIVYNGRFVPGWAGDWWYEKHVVNAGIFDLLKPGIFTHSDPAYRFSAMADLF